MKNSVRLAFALFYFLPQGQYASIVECVSISEYKKLIQNTASHEQADLQFALSLVYLKEQELERALRTFLQALNP